MDTNERIRELMEERGWTEYRLAKKAGLSQSTVINIFRRNTVPSIATLEAICSAFQMSLAQFFDVGETTPSEEIRLLSSWRQLNARQQAAIMQLMETMK